MESLTETKAPCKTYVPRPEWRAKWLKLSERDSDTKAMCLAAEQFACRFARRDFSGPTLLVLAGRNGVGKTLLTRNLVAWAQAVRMDVSYHRGWWSKTPNVEFVEWADIASESEGTRDGRWADVIKRDLLAIDDIGAEVDPYKSELPTSNLARLLNTRERMFTIATTNYPPESWAERWDKRVEDRLHRNSEIVVMRESQSWWNAGAKSHEYN